MAVGTGSGGRAAGESLRGGTCSYVAELAAVMVDSGADGCSGDCDGTVVAGDAAGRISCSFHPPYCCLLLTQP